MLSWNYRIDTRFVAVLELCLMHLNCYEKIRNFARRLINCLINLKKAIKFVCYPSSVFAFLHRHLGQHRIIGGALVLAVTQFGASLAGLIREIGRASCRERV